MSNIVVYLKSRFELKKLNANLISVAKKTINLIPVLKVNGRRRIRRRKYVGIAEITPSELGHQRCENKIT